VKHLFVMCMTLILAVAPTLAQTGEGETAAQAAAAAASGAVKRAVICSGVAEREPADALTSVPAATGKIFCFTEIAGMEGKTITHRWVKDGATVAEIPISVGAARWRCYSTKTIAGMAGAWTVEIIDDAGSKIGEAAFTVAAE